MQHLLRFLYLLCLVITARSVVRATVEPVDFMKDAMNIRWDWNTNTLVYSQVAPDGYWHIWSASYSPNTNKMSNIKALSYQNPLLPGRNTGAQTLTPDGRFIIFGAEKSVHPCPWGRNFSQVPPNAPGWGCSFPSIPGFGAYMDLWAMTIDGSQAWLLHSLPNVTENYATLITQISHDGTKVAWSQRYYLDLSDKLAGGGLYTIMIADLVVSAEGVPSVANTQSFMPNNTEAFYEIGDFTADNSKLMVCSNYATRDFAHNQLFLLDVATKQFSAPLTPATAYAEHPHLVPAGDKFVYMSSEGDNTYLGTDWWIMSADGSSREQLTYMNRFPDAMTAIFGASVWAGDSYGFSPDGTFFLGTIQTNLVAQTAVTRRVHMPPTRYAEDFFSQGESAYTAWTPSTGEWKVSDGQSTPITATYTFGSSTDIPVRADWSGTHVAVPTVYSTTAAEYRYGTTSLAVGQPGDVPVPADYDGDRKYDAVVYRPSTGEWFGRLSGLDNSFGDLAITWGGEPGDVPFSCDFDGDNLADIGIYRAGQWRVLLSSTGCVDTQPLLLQLGGNVSNILPMPSDYTGLGLCSPATFNNATAEWQWLPNNGSLEFLPLRTRQWGYAGEWPVVDLDVDGDGRSELTTVSATGRWLQQVSATNYSAHFFGIQVQSGARGDLFLPLHPVAVRSLALAAAPPTTPSSVPGTPTAMPTATSPKSCFSSNFIASVTTANPTSIPSPFSSSTGPSSPSATTSSQQTTVASSSPSPAAGGGTAGGSAGSSRGSKGKDFPWWAGLIIAIAVLAAVGVVAGVLVFRHMRMKNSEDRSYMITS